MFYMVWCLQSLTILSTNKKKVWLAKWGLHDVAVKKLNSALLSIDAENTSKEFQDEVNFMRSIRHPNIVLFVMQMKKKRFLKVIYSPQTTGFWAPALRAMSRSL